MGKNFDKFLLLMWKDFLLQWRHPIQTAVEILAPLVVASALVAIRSLLPPEENAAILYIPFINEVPRNLEYMSNYTFAYSPRNPILNKIVTEAMQPFINSTTSEQLGTTPEQLDNSQALQVYLSGKVNEFDGYYYNNFIVGIQFDDSLAGATTLPSNVNVTIRFPAETSYGTSWSTNALFPQLQTPGPRNDYSNYGDYPDYYMSGFLTLQQELSYSIIKHFKNSSETKSVPIYLQRFPYPRWFEDDFLTILQFILGLIIVLSFLYPCVSIVKVITVEKEKQLKETMKIMGLPSWLHWTAWFIKTFLMQFIPLTLIVVLLIVKWYPDSNFAIFTYSNPLIIFLFIFLYVCATITFCFAISVFFSRANLAAVVAGMVWVITYFLFTVGQGSPGSTSLAAKLAISLFSNSAMALGFQIIVQYEGMEKGIQWDNLWEPTSLDNTLVLGHIMIMLLVDAILYLLITLYVETIFPGEYGVPQKWYFPILPSYWCGNRKYLENEGNQEEPTFNEYYETEPTELEVGIRIKNLGKQFSKTNVAVKDLSFNLFKDQITVLLGHNGAGKTTTMSMLTGMFPPTSGTAVVAGYDIRTQMPAVRDSLGLCPQHNILFDDLTVKEHLYFYSKLKGLNKEEINAEIDKFVELLELTDKRNAKASTLSGGMKRKLSVAIALCGGSSVVMCDEPSSGMDPSARRALWDLLQSQKKGRTILLTTHFMDEADLLGDRIAIMTNGKLECCGSSYFLKKKYGAGYHLIMDIAASCDTSRVTSLLQKYVPNIQIESNIGSELSYLLNEDYSSIFQEMLNDLEQQATTLGVLNYGISLTSFDEVFMKANTKKSLDKDTDNLKNGNIEDIGADPTTPDKLAEVKLDLGHNLLTGCTLWCNQVLAMVIKRGLSIMRSWFIFLLQIVIPIALISTIVILNKFIENRKDLPNLAIEFGSYIDPVTVLSGNASNEYKAAYVNLLTGENTRVIDWKDEDLHENMLSETEEKLSEVRARYLTGATFWDNKSITVWFNNDPLHTPPLTLQTVMNAIFQQEMSSQDYRIQIFNHPLPFWRQTTDNDEIDPLSMSLQIGINLSFAMAFVSAFYIMFYIRERVSNAKHLQFVSGVRVIIFWGSSYICDLITFVVISLFIIATFAAFQEEGFSTVDDLSRMFLLLFHLGLCGLPLTYLLSFLPDVPASGYAKMVFFNVITGTGLFITMYAIRPVLADKGLDYLHKIFLVLPLYSFSISVRDMSDNYQYHKQCDPLLQACIDTYGETIDCNATICENVQVCCKVRDYYDTESPGIGLNIIYAYLVAAILFIFLLCIEYGIFARIFNRKSPLPNPPAAQADSDVAKEKQIIKNASMDEIKTYDLVMHSVTKYYKNVVAVNDLCLGVNKYECFGLLGVNGAGKTTTFKMMTGEISVSRGDAWVRGLNLRTDMKQIHHSIGYCPQFDALLDNLTCRETIIIFSLLRGFTMREGKSMATQLARNFDFLPHLSKKVKQLSGGNKRKLSTALTLIGDPQVLYLDEPTTGMDPATKRYLWRALCKVRDSGKCIVLTSHSMEECEALCTRIAIMVNGTFMCLGSTQHLKSKFSEGYTLIVRLSKIEGRYDLEPVKIFVNGNFSNVLLREVHLELATFYIADKTKSWSQMFGIMEHGKRTLNIEDYSLGQSSLEQVFLSFTKYQQ